jgi:hypothetical protein
MCGGRRRFHRARGRLLPTAHEDAEPMHTPPMQALHRASAVATSTTAIPWPRAASTRSRRPLPAGPGRAARSPRARGSRLRPPGRATVAGGLAQLGEPLEQSAFLVRRTADVRLARAPEMRHFDRHHPHEQADARHKSTSAPNSCGFQVLRGSEDLVCSGAPIQGFRGSRGDVVTLVQLFAGSS